MQLKIHIRNDRELFLQMGYNYQLMSGVYCLLKGCEELSGFIHSEGWHSGGAVFKLFTFSPIMGIIGQTESGSFLTGIYPLS